MDDLSRTYTQEQLDLWRSKRLPDLWREKYPHIFDADDLRLALSQNRYHFGEWCVAVYFAKQGYKVLVEKYLYKSHPDKIEAMTNLFKPKRIEYIKQLLKYPKPRHQAPDLLVYKGKKFFFVEVKKDKDHLTDSQKKCFENLERKLHRKIIICSIKLA